MIPDVALAGGVRDAPRPFGPPPRSNAHAISAVDAQGPPPHTPIMTAPLPPWTRRHGEEHDQAECDEFAAMSPQDRWRVLAELSRLAARLLTANPHRVVALELRDERSPEALATWRMLMERARG